MYKYNQIILKFACIFFLGAFIFSCDSQTQPPQAPKVVTQKIASSTPAQPAPINTPVQTPPAAKQQPVSPQQQKIPAQPATPSKTIRPIPAPEKSTPAPGKNIAAVQTVTATIPPKAKQTAVTVEKPEKVVPVPTPLDQPAEKILDKSKSQITKAEGAAETGPDISEAMAAEADLKKLMADTTGAYRPAGKVDPFLPLFEEKPAVPEETADAEKQKKKRRMPLTPLERVDLAQLKLVGIIQAPSGNKALVEESSGKGYIIKKGTFIGIHAGRVLEIQKDRVIVEEEVENVLGQFTLEKKELKLQKPPGEF